MSVILQEFISLVRYIVSFLFVFVLNSSELSPLDSIFYKYLLILISLMLRYLHLAAYFTHICCFWSHWWWSHMRPYHLKFKWQYLPWDYISFVVFMVSGLNAAELSLLSGIYIFFWGFSTLLSYHLLAPYITYFFCFWSHWCCVFSSWHHNFLVSFVSDLKFVELSPLICSIEYSSSSSRVLSTSPHCCLEIDTDTLSIWQTSEFLLLKVCVCAFFLQTYRCPTISIVFHSISEFPKFVAWPIDVKPFYNMFPSTYQFPKFVFQHIHVQFIPLCSFLVMKLHLHMNLCLGFANISEVYIIKFVNNKMCTYVIHFVHSWLELRTLNWTNITVLNLVTINH